MFSTLSGVWPQACVRATSNWHSLHHHQTHSPIKCLIAAFGGFIMCCCCTLSLCLQAQRQSRSGTASAAPQAVLDKITLSSRDATGTGRLNRLQRRQSIATCCGVYTHTFIPQGHPRVRMHHASCLDLWYAPCCCGCCLSPTVCSL